MAHARPTSDAARTRDPASHRDAPAVPYVVGLSFIGAIIVQLAAANLRARRDEAIAAEIDEIERPTAQGENESNLIAVATDLVYAAAKRERLSLDRAERRISRLYQLGTVLVVLSALVPFVLVMLYLETDPLLRIAQLQKVGVVDAKALVEVAQRDWHLLLAGVSFGLLFLAAARGIFQSEVRQREAYQTAARWEAYYGDLSRGLRIADRLAREESEYGDRVRGEAVRRVIDRLLDSGVPKQETRPAAPAADDGESVVPEHWRTMISLFAKSKA